MAAAEPARARRSTRGADEEKPKERRRAPRRRTGVPNAASAMKSASEQLSELLGRPPESVSSLRPTDDGWEAQVEVVELERIPDTTSVLASYRVSLDENGELVSYERTRRYTRGMIDRQT
ncbi:gas vesicle protein [Streptomyces sp. ms191]|uniref:gas vesicle protein GvpO n=1 Tax=unclassified Streptomyces TaxID=2593676 RepID=UPI0011CEBCF2|nr:gas vesicle protein [Streptomyces sp. ms191]TXS32859.1 gas vesicle protein [Streptomyces sp. ms191]